MIRFASLLLSATLLFAIFQQKSCDKKPQGSADSGKSAPAATTPPAPRGAEFDPNAAERDIRRKIEDLRNDIESKMSRSVTREFDSTELSGYSSFEDQIQSFMDATSEVRIFLRPANVQVTPGDAQHPARAQAQVDAEMRYTLKSNPSQEKQKRQQLLLDLVYRQSEWRITKFEPRNFFVP